MAKVTFRTWEDGEIVTAEMLNEQIRDQGNSNWVGEDPADLDYYSAADTKTRIPIGNEGQIFKVASGLPAWGSLITERQGGNANEWDLAGSSNYVPSNSKIQCGVANISVSASTSGTATITFPTPFAVGSGPLVLVSCSSTANPTLFRNITTNSYDRYVLGWPEKVDRINVQKVAQTRWG